MPDYKNGKVYVIRNTENDSVYVGSTTQPLSRRMAGHRGDVDRRITKLYNMMNEIGIDKFYIELIENYPCNNKEELFVREGYFIREYDSFKNGYNGRIEGRSTKEYREDNKEKRKENWKTYYENNKEKIKEYNKEYCENNKDKIKEKKKEYRENNKDKIKEYKKEYREDNKEKIKEYSKEYRENNKEKINENAKEKVTCECGSIIRKVDLSRHIKTIKHQDYMNNKASTS